MILAWLGGLAFPDCLHARIGMYWTMKKTRFIRFLAISSFLFFSGAILAEHQTQPLPKWTLSANISETAAFLIGKKILDWPITFIPVHLDGSYSFTDNWGLAFGVVYRYENYGKEIKNKFGEGKLSELWTNYHELFLMAGPRYSFFATANQGLFAAFKAGLGGALSSGGYAVSAVMQPEIGYSLLFGGRTAFFMDFAAGLLLNLPLLERPRLGFDTSAIGWLVHRTIPVLRVGIGMAF